MSTSRISRDTLTTGQVARVCRVCPRTISKWIDSGRIKGYRLPDSNDRRVLRCELLPFMRAAGIPTDLLLGNTVVLVVGAAREINVEGIEVLHAATPAAAGVLCGKRVIDVLVVDLAIGLAEASDVLAVARGEHPAVGGVAVVSYPHTTTDEIERATAAGYMVVGLSMVSATVAELSAAAKRATTIPAYGSVSTRKVVSR